MSEPENAPKPPRRTRRPSLVPRAQILGLDPLEQRASWVAAGLTALLALSTVFLWIRNPYIASSVSKLANGKCPPTSSLQSGTCEVHSHLSASAWEFRLFFIVLVGVVLAYFAWRHKRAGVATFSIFLGLGSSAIVGPLSLIGPLYLLFGVWLIMRAFRLQKYGDASFRGANKAAREQAAARKATRSGRSVNSISDGGRNATPAPSKRYTPKKSQSRRR